MAKGASIRFKSYKETVQKLLDILQLHRELKKYDKIILKPNLAMYQEESTPKEFAEEVVKFCLIHKNPVAEIFIVEGGDGYETADLFEAYGYKTLAEKYGVGLIDLNEAETEQIENEKFLKFPEIIYPKILREGMLISITRLSESDETGISGAISTMLGAFPSTYYSGFFSQGKNKIRKWPIKYSIHDIVRCKVPEFAIVDASKHGQILAGLPFEIDKQSAKLLGKEWQEIPYLKLLDDYLTEDRVEEIEE